ncbi:MAG: AraC family transcriptional regulator ligand-binding domain-containing protein [Paracoccus sp. (in: a-proteobacteria)]
MAEYFNRAGSLAGLPELAGALGGDLPAAMRHVGLSPQLLHKPDERVSFDRLCALLDHCAQIWDMPDLGLRMTIANQLDMLGSVALVTRVEPTIRSALAAIAENLILHSNAFTVSLEETGDVAAVAANFHCDPPGLDHYALATVAVTCAVLKQLSDGKVRIVEVSVQQPRGGITPAMCLDFGHPLQFGAERNAVWFERRILDTPIDRSDHAFHDLIARYLRSSRDELSGRLTDRVRREIARQMEAGDCGLEQVARALRIEPRSLQRGLKTEGSGFRDLQEDWRRARALTLITRTRMPLSQVSQVVGYADQSVFTRAFQRWYGRAPLAFRKKGGPKDGAP